MGGTSKPTSKQNVNHPWWTIKGATWSVCAFEYLMMTVGGNDLSVEQLCN